MDKLEQEELDRVIVQRVMEYRRVLDTFLIGAKGGGTNRAIVVSEE